MQEFIDMAMKSLGTDEKTTRGATGGLLNLIQKNADGGDFQELLGKLPGADLLMKEGPSPGAGLGGAIGGLVGNLAGGNDVAKAIGSLGFLSESGIDAGKIAQLVPLFLSFVKDKAGQDLLSRLLGKLPELANVGS